jgi:hypothetical protein
MSSRLAFPPTPATMADADALLVDRPSRLGRRAPRPSDSFREIDR